MRVGSKQRGFRSLVGSLAAFGVLAIGGACGEPADGAALRILEQAAGELVAIAEGPSAELPEALARWRAAHEIALQTALDEAVRTMTPERREAFAARWAEIATRLRARLGP